MISKFAAAPKIATALCLISAAFCLMSAQPAQATVFGSVKGIVHDPQHRPIDSAKVTLHAAHSSVRRNRNHQSGRGIQLHLRSPGRLHHHHFGRWLRNGQQPLAVASNSSDILHFPLALATIQQSA